MDRNDRRREFVNLTLSGDEAPPTAEMIESYKQGWAAQGFPDVGSGKHIDVLNNPTANWGPEARLMAQIIKEAIDDATGQGMLWNKPYPGRVQPRCGCRRTQGTHSVACVHTYTYQRQAIEWFQSEGFEEMAENLNLDVGWFRKQLANGTIPRFFITAGPLATMRRPRGRPRKEKLDKDKTVVYPTAHEQTQTDPPLLHP